MLSVSGPRNCTFLAISGPRIRNQKSPEWCTFWGHKLPGNGYFWCHKLPKRFSFVSGAINCQNGAVSGAINCQNGRQNLYETLRGNQFHFLKLVCSQDTWFEWSVHYFTCLIAASSSKMSARRYLKINLSPIHLTIFFLCLSKTFSHFILCPFNFINQEDIIEKRFCASIMERFYIFTISY